jgi:hypothetical protein
MVFNATFNNISCLLVEETHVQWVPSTTIVMSSILRAWRGVLDTTLCDKVCQWLATGRWFSPCTPVSSTNKHEILLNVALNTMMMVCLCLLLILFHSSETNNCNLEGIPIFIKSSGTFTAVKALVSINIAFIWLAYSSASEK